MKLFSASWVLPMEGPPVEGGALLVSGDRIQAVGRARDLLREWPGAAREDLPGCALVPGLVNAHAHLDLSSLGDVPEEARGSVDFIGWILEVVRRKRGAAPETFGRGVCEGARECHEGGQAVVADVLSVPAAGGCYPPDGPRVAVFPEVIAPREGQVDAALARAVSTWPVQPARLAGLSPHAPYTAGEEAYRVCARTAAEWDGRLMTHLAESPQEMVFCVGGAGEVSGRLYPALGLEPPRSPGTHPVDWLEDLGLLTPRTVLVHAVHLRGDHFDLLARRGSAVVLCPRSNRGLGVGQARGRDLRTAGIPVGLGTDSRLSAGNLNLWEEMMAAVDVYNWSPEEALEAATLGGARLLGLERDTGRFAPGCRADIITISLPAGRGLWDRLLPAASSGCRWIR